MNKLYSISLMIIACLVGVVSNSAHSATILFAHVDQTGSYVDDGNRIRDMLTADGHTVTTRYLNQATYNDYSSFDQVFVYDLYVGSNNNANQAANYANIANWYNTLPAQNLILDGRIISSTTPWVNPPETAWVQNYAEQLGLRGGGLVLGTDHANPGQNTGAFVDGINNILDNLNIDRFSDFYNVAPFEAVVDVNSPLYVPSLQACSFDATQQCINDNSSTSFAATGLQGNGQTLTPVAFHGNALDAWERAAVSTTMGSITFGTCGNPGQPPCAVSAPPLMLLLGLSLVGVGAFRRHIKA